MSETKPNTSQPNPSSIAPSSLDCSRSSTGVWLVKVPKYLAKKWTDAQENSEVGVIRITQSKTNLKSKQEVVFRLNENLGRSVNIKVGDKTTEERIPVEHKFLMTPLGNQAMYILKQSDEASKEPLSIIGKVMQRAECTPVQDDTNYIQLKRETVKQFTEPKRQIKMADDYIQRRHYLPKPLNVQNTEKNAKPKRLRKDKEKVLDILFNAFGQHQYYNIKDLVKLTQQPPVYLKDILHEICRYNGKGQHKNTWELKEEFKHGNSNSESNKKAAVASLSKEGGDKDNDDFMDEEDEDDEDFDEVDDDNEGDDDMAE